MYSHNLGEYRDEAIFCVSARRNATRSKSYPLLQKTLLGRPTPVQQVSCGFRVTLTNVCKAGNISIRHSSSSHTVYCKPRKSIAPILFFSSHQITPTRAQHGEKLKTVTTLTLMSRQTQFSTNDMRTMTYPQSATHKRDDRCINRPSDKRGYCTTNSRNVRSRGI
jgi:hypothetical protein